MYRPIGNELTMMESSLTTQWYVAIFPLPRAVVTPRPLSVTRLGVARITTEIYGNWCVPVSKALYAVNIPQTAYYDHDVTDVTTVLW